MAARGLTLGFGAKTVLSGVDVDFPRGSITALIGPTGSGKTTFLRSLNRMNDKVRGYCRQGDVELDGASIWGRDVGLIGLRRRVGMVFQRPNPFPMSIAENVIAGVRAHRIAPRSQVQAIAETRLREVGLWEAVADRLGDSPFRLSGGQQQLLCLARALAIGASDAYLSPAQTQTTPSLANIPLAISAQEINYNLPGAPAHLKLDDKVLAKMYLGKITTWNNPEIATLNPGVSLPNTKVVPVHRADGSGDTFLFTSFASKADSSDWTISPGTTVAFPPVPGNLGATGNGGMVTTCGSTKGCVAYIGVSYQSKATSAGLGEAMLANSSGQYLLPTADAVSAEPASFAGQTPANESISLIYGSPRNGYPIVNYEYAIVNTTQSNADKAQAIRAFLDWSISASDGNAASFLGPVNFVALPSRVGLSQAQIAKIGKG